MSEITEERLQWIERSYEPGKFPGNVVHEMPELIAEIRRLRTENAKLREELEDKKNTIEILMRMPRAHEKLGKERDRYKAAIEQIHQTVMDFLACTKP